MEYIVVAFRSRAHTVGFYEFLRKNGVHTEIVNTPKEAGVGCGLSVKITKNQVGLIKRALKILSYRSFIGVFLVSNHNGARKVSVI